LADGPARNIGGLGVRVNAPDRANGAKRANQHQQHGLRIGRSFVRIWADEKNRSDNAGAGMGLHFYAAGANCHANDM
jgi:hypothetical protein